MPDKKDVASLLNAEEAKPARAAKKDVASLLNAEDATAATEAPVEGATPASPIPAIPAVTTPDSQLLPGETQGVDAAGNAIVSRPKPKPMQAARGVDADVARTNLDYVTKAVSKYLKPQTEFEKNNDVVTVPTGKGTERVYGMNMGNAFAGERATGAISTEERGVMQNLIKNEIAANEDFVREDVQKHAAAFNKFYSSIGSPVINPNIDPATDPKVLAPYRNFKVGQIDTEEQQAVADLKSRYHVIDQDSIMGVHMDNANPEYKKELQTLQASFQDKRDEVNSAVFNLAARKRVGEAVKNGEALNPAYIGLDMLELTGQKEIADKVRRDMQRNYGKMNVYDQKALMESGFRAMQYGMMDAIANGDDETAKKLSDQIQNPQDKILAALPEYKKTQMARAISSEVAANTPWIYRGITGYSVGQEAVDAAAAKLGMTPEEVKEAGIKPEDISGAGSILGRFTSSIIKNSFAAAYETGARLGAQVAQDVHGSDLTEFNKHFNESWYDNTWIGKNLGATDAENQQLFGQATNVNTQRGNDFLKDVNNPNAGSFTWNIPAIIGQVAEGSGQMLAFAEGGRAFGGPIARAIVGEAEVAANTAKAVDISNRVGLAANTVFTQYGSTYADALNAIGDKPEDESRRELYTMLKLGTSALSEQILPDTEIRANLFGSGTRSGMELADAIRRDGFGILNNKGTLRSILGRAVKNGLIDSGKETSEDVLNEQMDKIVDFLVAPEQYKTKDYNKSMEEAAITSVISNFLPTFSGGVRRTVRDNKLNQQLLFHVGNSPSQYIDALNEQIKVGDISQEEGNDKIKLINTMSDIVNNSVPIQSVVTGATLTPTQRVDYANNLLRETMLKAQKDGTKDEVMHEYIDKEMADLKASRNAILAAPVAPNTSVTLPPMPADLNLFAPNNGLAPTPAPAPPTEAQLRAVDRMLADPTLDEDGRKYWEAKKADMQSRMPAPAEQSAPAPSLQDLQGKTVSYNGHTGVLNIDEGGKATVESDNLIVELPESNAASLASEYNLTPVDATAPEAKGKKHNPDLDQYVSEEEVVIDGRPYKVHTNAMGNVEAVSPTDNLAEVDTNPDLAIRAEIIRNRNDYRAVSEVQATQPEAVAEVVNREIASVNEAAVINTIYTDTLNETAASAVDELYDKGHSNDLSQEQRAAAEEWLFDAMDRVDNLLRENPGNIHYQGAIENLETIYNLLNDAQGSNSNKAPAQQPAKGKAKRTAKRTADTSTAAEPAATENVQPQGGQTDERSIVQPPITVANAPTTETNQTQQESPILNGQTSDIQAAPASQQTISEAANNESGNTEGGLVAPASADLVQEAHDIGKNIKSIGAFGFKKPETTEEALFEIAQQLNSSESEAATTRRTMGDRISDIALQLFPTAKVGDTFQSTISSPVNTQSNGESNQESSTQEVSTNQERQAGDAVDGGRQEDGRQKVLDETGNKWGFVEEATPPVPSAPAVETQAPAATQIENVTDSTGAIVIEPAPAPTPAPQPSRDAVTGKPIVTGDPLTDATNLYNWHRTIVEKKEGNIANLELQIADEEDARATSERIMGEIADPTNKAYQDNARVLTATGARLKTLRDSLSKAKALLKHTNEEMAKVKAEMESLVDKTVAPVAEPITEEETPYQEENTKLQQAIDDIARIEAELDVMKAAKEQAGASWTADEASDFLRDAKAMKTALTNARRAKTKAEGSKSKLTAKALAASLRRYKGDDNIASASVFGVSPKIGNVAIELVAKGIETGGSIVASIQAGVDHINNTWLTKWDEAAFRKLMGEGLPVGLTPDQIRAQIDTGIPLSAANTTAARAMVDDIKANNLTIKEAMAAIDAIPKMSDGTKANIKNYVNRYSVEEIFRPGGEQLASQHLTAAGNNYDAAIASIQAEQATVTAAATSPQQKANIAQMYIYGLTSLQSQKTAAGINTGALPFATPGTPVAPTGFIPGERSIKDKLTEVLQNKYSRAEQFVKGSTVPVTKENDFATAVQLKKSKAAYWIEKVREHVGYENPKPGTMFYRMRKEGIDIVRWSKYLYALHAKERNDQNAKERKEKADEEVLRLNLAIDAATDPVEIASLTTQRDNILNNVPGSPYPYMPDGGSGMFNQQAKDIIDQVALDGHTALFEKYRLEFKAEVIDKILDVKFENGIITAADYQKFKTHYQFYVPLKIDEDQENASLAPGKKIYYSSSAINGKDIYRSKGSIDHNAEKRNNPVTQALHDLENAYRSAEDNKAMFIMGNFIKGNPNDEVWSVQPAIYDKKTGPTGKVIDTVPRPQPKDTVASYYDNGTLYYIVSADPGIQNMFAKVPFEKIVQKAAIVSRYMTLMYTQLSPTFLVRNIFLDQQDAYQSLLAQNDKNFLKHFRSYTFKGQARILDALVDGVTNEWTPIIEDMKKNGGEISFLSHVANENAAEKAVKLYESMGNINPLRMAASIVTTKNPNAAVRQGKDKIKNFVGALEQMTRIQVYRAAVEAGIDKLMAEGKTRAEAEVQVNREKAALISRNATVDFEKRGTLGPLLSAYKAFANPGVQGVANVLYGLKNNNPNATSTAGKYLTRSRMFVGAMIALGNMSAELGRFLGDCDPQYAEDCWDEIPEYAKARNLMLPTFLITGKGTGYTSIPLGRAFTFFPYIGTAISGAIHGTLSPGQFASNVLGVMADNYNPIGGDAPVLQQAAGNAGPAVALATNKSPMGDMPIRPEIDHKLRSQDYFPKSSNATIETSDWLHRMTGGEPGHAGAVEVSPNQLDFMMQTVGGGIYNFMKQAGTAINHAQDGKGNLGEVPVVSMFHRQSRMGGTNAKFFNLLKKSEDELLTPKESQEAIESLQRLVAGEIINADQAGRRFNVLESNQRQVRSNVGKEMAKKYAEGQPVETTPTTTSGGSLNEGSANEGSASNEFPAQN